MTRQQGMIASWRKLVVGFLFCGACTSVAIPEAWGIELHQGLVAYWPLDEGVGETTADSFGGMPDVGELRNEPEWLGASDAKVGTGALRFFDGFEQDVLIPNSIDLDIGANAVSVSAWVNVDLLPSELTDGFSGILDSNEDSYVLYLDRSNQELRFKVTDEEGDAERPGVPESQLTPAAWSHVLGVYDGNAGIAKIYFNGEVVDSHSNANLTGLVFPGQTASIGANATTELGNPATRFFSGAIDDVAVWNRPLGRAEASYLYNAGNGTAIGAANPDLTFVSDTPPVVPVRPTADPVLHFAFEGDLRNSGSGGAALDGLLIDTPDLNDELYTTGSVGLALDLRENPVSQEFDGDGVEVDYLLPENGTIIFDYTVGEYYNFQSLWTNSIDPNDWEMWIYNDGRVRGRVQSNAFVEYDLDNLGGLGGTYEIAFTWQRVDDNVLLKLFVDGEQRDQDLVGSWVEPGEVFFIAGGDDANHFGNGIWDEFRIYDVALSAGEVLYLFSGAELACDPNSGGDFDGNGRVEFADFLILSANFGTDVESHQQGDVDCNGKVDFADFLALSANFGNSVGVAASHQVPEPTGYMLACVAGLLCGMLRRSAACPSV